MEDLIWFGVACVVCAGGSLAGFAIAILWDSYRESRRRDAAGGGVTRGGTGNAADARPE